MDKFCGDVNERINGITALELACDHGAPAVKYLLDHGADPNLCDDNSPCAWLRSLGNTIDGGKVMQLLLKHNVDLSIHLGEGLGAWPSALYLSAAHRNTEVTRVLLDHGFDKDAHDGGGKYAFDLAIEGRGGDGSSNSLSLDLLEMLLPTKLSADSLLRMNQCLSPNFIRKMVDRGADPRAIDPESGVTVIYEAIGQQISVECLKTLFELGAGSTIDSRLRLEDREGRTVLHIACECAFGAENGIEKTVDIIRLLVEQGAPINARNQGGLTALVYSVTSTDVKRDVVRILETLVSLGADPTLLPGGHSSLLESCIKSSANAHVINWCFSLECSKRLGFTAEDVHEEKDVPKFVLTDPRFASWLTEPSFEPSRTKSTVLDAMLLQAAEMGDSGRFELILSHGGSLQARTDAGNTPLFIACICQKVDMSFLELLVDKYGYSVHDRDAVTGGSLLHIAECKSTADFLISRGVDESIKDEDGKLWHEVVKWNA
jgi:ankyrin repeat protein